MYHMDISPQKAGAIMRKMRLANRSEHPNGTDLRTEGVEVMLSTGAKLYYNEGKGYHISGYTPSGSDVSPYRGSEEMHKL
jgi:hypothetical protein